LASADVYAPKNWQYKQTTHINQVEFDGIHHNNQMESFNGVTICYREKVVRDLKKDDSAIIAGLQVYPTTSGRTSDCPTSPRRVRLPVST